ncbi:Pvc16 family protein [Kordia sp.]|uniref:Pvc16 family protein n=1 Tax=Kordia sp. TaxID=1965332 RepID=UPI003B5C4C23
MIEKALQFTGKALNQFVKTKFNLEEDVVKINPIIDQNGNVPLENQNKIIVSLIHVEQDNTQQFYNRNQKLENGNYQRAPRSQRYNLFTLITPNFEDYIEALKFLDTSIQFFQINEMVDATKNAGIPTEIGKLEYEFQKGENYMQMQNLWTALGTKYQPSVIYKIRLVSIASDEVEGFDTAIKSINTDAKP